MRLPGGRQGMGQRPSAGAGADDDDVVVVVAGHVPPFPGFASRVAAAEDTAVGDDDGGPWRRALTDPCEPRGELPPPAACRRRRREVHPERGRGNPGRPIPTFAPGSCSCRRGAPRSRCRHEERPAQSPVNGATRGFDTTSTTSMRTKEIATSATKATASPSGPGSSPRSRPTGPDHAGRGATGAIPTMPPANCVTFASRRPSHFPEPEERQRDGGIDVRARLLTARRIGDRDRGRPHREADQRAAQEDVGQRLADRRRGVLEERRDEARRRA